MKVKNNIFVFALILSLILSVGTVVATDELSFDQSDFKNDSLQPNNVDFDILGQNCGYVSTLEADGKTGLLDYAEDSASPRSNQSEIIHDVDDGSLRDYPDVSNNSTNKCGSFSDLNNLINDLNKSEIILNHDYAYRQECDGNFSEGIVINRSVTIDGQGHVLYFERPAYVFHINANDVILKNIVFYNPYRLLGIISCNKSCITSNITVIPEDIILSLSIISNDTFDIYNESSVINIEFETSIANAYFWVEIPGLLEKTNLTSDNEGKSRLSISNITKHGYYSILCDFIQEKYVGSYYIRCVSIRQMDSSGRLETVFGDKKRILILYREKPKSNNSFNDLQSLIDNSVTNEINLKKDYEYYSGDKAVNINKSVVINGNGHIIDGKNVSKIFNIRADDVVIKNITFINANSNPFKNNLFFDSIFIAANNPNAPLGFALGYNSVDYSSGNFYDSNMYNHYSVSGYSCGAIYCSGNNLKIIDSSFINNSGLTGGGVYIVGDNAELINLLFINNTAQKGGAIYNSGNNAQILNSQFDSNYALYAGGSICSYGDINIQNCNFGDASQDVMLCDVNWQIDNISSAYYNLFVKFNFMIDFKFNLTHIKNDCYNLKITCNDLGYKGSTVNKKFCLNACGKDYILQTDENSQANIDLKLSNGIHEFKVYNPFTNWNISKLFNVSDSVESNSPLNNNSDTNNNDSADLGSIDSTNDDIGDKKDNKISKYKFKKVSPKFIAKSKVFSKKTKVKKYSVTLKTIKNAWITLKINGKIFKAKTNAKGKATFKITKLNKKGKYTATIKYAGSRKYKALTKKVRFVIR